MRTRSQVSFSSISTRALRRSCLRTAPVFGALRSGTPPRAMIVPLAMDGVRCCRDAIVLDVERRTVVVARPTASFSQAADTSSKPSRRERGQFQFEARSFSRLTIRKWGSVPDIGTKPSNIRQLQLFRDLAGAQTRGRRTRDD